MSEKSSDDRGRYYVFYYDSTRNVELAMRLLDEPHPHNADQKPIEYQVRAKIVGGDGTPYVAHFNCIRTGRKTKSFELDNNAQEFFRIADFIRIPNRKGADVTCKLAPANMLATMQASMGEISDFRSVKRRKQVLEDTPKKLENRAKYKKREEDKISAETADKDKPQSKQEVLSNQKRISSAVKDIKPRVFVLTEDGLVSRYMYEDYLKLFYHKKQPKSLQVKKEKAAAEDAEKNMHEAMLDSNKERFKRDPATLNEHDEAWASATGIIKTTGDKTFRYTCKDALLVTEEIDGKKIERDADHTVLRLDNKRINGNGFARTEINAIYQTQDQSFEVWILDKDETPTEPHFHIIKRTKKGKIKSAARFQFTRDDETGEVMAIPWPYNEHDFGANPITHPSHNMYVDDRPTDYEKAKEIAALFAPDAIVAWKKHFKEDLKQNNMLGDTPTDSHISNATYYGSGIAPKEVAPKATRQVG